MTTEHSPTVKAAITKHAEACVAFEKLRDDADRLAAELETHRKAASAADAEANSARESVKALIRDGNPSPKKIHELKAQERAAYTLAEDYRSIAAEVEALFALAKVEAGDAKKDERECFANIVATRRDEQLAALPENLQPVIHAMALVERRMRLDGPGASWAMNGLVSLKEAMLREVFSVIERTYDATADDAKQDTVVDTVARPMGRERYDTMSPSMRYRLSVENQRAVANDARIAATQGGR
ncbi:hypothetical protein PMO31116_02675 [Pandoraea morbifera]|uniref:Uncharacterized protein n=1 Tax=Pandoraea morbifera TaxID=2508300 RepID=A0A5E4VLM8_9BURK|nr:hypothetical protein [Pandoraea morbifera]VVE12379.1 hypothetical protein PMO31116_02675 [Pandoraea morbifera]